MPETTIGEESVGRIFRLKFTGHDPREDYLKVLGTGEKNSLEVIYHRNNAAKSRGLFLSRDLPIEVGRCRYVVAYSSLSAMSGSTGFCNVGDVLMSIDDITETVRDFPGCRFREYQMDEHAIIAPESVGHTYRAWIVYAGNDQAALYLKVHQLTAVDPAVLVSEVQFGGKVYRGAVELENAPRVSHNTILLRLTELDRPKKEVFYQPCCVLELEDITDRLEWHPACQLGRE